MVVADTRFAGYRGAVSRVPRNRADPAAIWEALQALAVRLDYIGGVNGGLSPLVTSWASSSSGTAGLYWSATAKGNTAATETDLFSYSVPGGTLAANGDALIVSAAGTFAGTAATNKRIRAYLGSTQILDTGNLPITVAQAWIFRATILRLGQSAQKFWADGTSSITYGTAAENLGGAVKLRLTGSGTNASDVVAEFIKIWRQPG